MRSVLAAVWIFFSAVANSAPVTWTLDSFVFGDGGAAGGFFVMDSITGEISTANIITTSDSAFAGDTYTAVNAVYQPFGPIIEFYTDNYSGQTDETAFILYLSSSDFSLSGGTYSINAGEFLCQSEAYCGSDPSTIGLRGTATVGYGSITGVPIPAAAWLFGSALAGLGWLKRKQAA